MLDVDIWEVSDGKRGKRIPNNKFKHHTTVNPDRTYKWEFKGLKLEFRIIKVWDVPVDVKIILGKYYNPNSKSDNTEP
jgi:hypothetical protein